MNRLWRTNWNIAGCARRVSSRFPWYITAGRVHIVVGFRADLSVEDLVIVEITSVEVVAPVHKKQLLTHSQQALGLLVSFNVTLIKDGITRVANGLSE